VDGLIKPQTKGYSAAGKLQKGFGLPRYGALMKIANYFQSEDCFDKSWKPGDFELVE
jgi:hypothetical protein